LSRYLARRAPIRNVCTLRCKAMALRSAAALCRSLRGSRRPSIHRLSANGRPDSTFWGSSSPAFSRAEFPVVTIQMKTPDGQWRQPTPCAETRSGFTPSETTSPVPNVVQTRKTVSMAEVIGRIFERPNCSILLASLLPICSTSDRDRIGSDLA
jgi:hypothetical protein